MVTFYTRWLHSFCTHSERFRFPLGRFDHRVPLEIEGQRIPDSPCGRLHPKIRLLDLLKCSMTQGATWTHLTGLPYSQFTCKYIFLSFCSNCLWLGDKTKITVAYMLSCPNARTLFCLYMWTVLSSLHSQKSKMCPTKISVNSPGKKLEETVMALLGITYNIYGSFSLPAKELHT